MTNWPYHPDLLAKPVPRYTSYPTAADFHEGVGNEDYARALAAIPSGATLSLYIHIPYCEQICWYCGCNTGIANRTQRLAAYLVALKAELAMVARMLGGRGRVRRIAFGGGSPNAISPVDFVRLTDRILTLFEARGPDISVELDPRGLTSEWPVVLAASQVTRVSMGIQTFAPHVQAAIGRIQPLADIERAMTGLRMRGIDAINFDLMYGLPGQTTEDLVETLIESIRLAPSRIALFGYAHLPQAIPRQRRIDATHLPDARTRFDQAARGHDLLTAAGYIPIGFDHFALPSDPLAQAATNGSVGRNFQGFTEDDADVLIGLGSSAISRLPGLLIQNEKNAGRYRERIGEGLLTATRGVRIDAEDEARGGVIADLLCRGAAVIPDGLSESMPAGLAPFLDRDLVRVDGKRIWLTEAGQPYVRCIAALFDRYRAPEHRGFSMAI